MLLHDSLVKFEHYMVTLDKSNETIRGYLSDLSSFEDYLEKKYNYPPYIDEITVYDIENYLYFLKEKKDLKPSSRSRQLYTLKSFWNYTYKKGISKKNIAMSIDPIKIRQKERIFLSKDEIDIFIQNIDHDLVKVVIETLFYTGMRISECLNLKLRDVDLSNNIIHIISGKGNKDRNIPINQMLLSLLKNYLDNIRPDVDSDCFFATKKTGTLSPAYVNRIISDTLKKLKWTKKVTAHTFRHSFASNLVQRGVNIVHVQKLLGHSNLAITSIYTHSNIDDLSESVNLL